MGGIQIGNLLGLMESANPFDLEQARREVIQFLNEHMVQVAKELEEKGETVIETSAGSFRLTKDDLCAAK